MKFSALAAAATLVGTEVLALVQGGVTLKATAAAIANTFQGIMGSNLASATTPDLGAVAGQSVHVTGTTTITGFASATAGVMKTTIFDGALTLTHNATSLILPTGANITTAAGDTARWVSEGSGNWRCLEYMRKSGRPLLPTNIPQRSASANTTTVAADANGHLLHPSADTTPRTFTIDSNANVPYEVGTSLTFVNQNGAGVLTIAITSDTMRLAGAGTTGSRTLAANGMATALKVTSTEWLIAGTGLT